MSDPFKDGDIDLEDLQYSDMQPTSLADLEDSDIDDGSAIIKRYRAEDRYGETIASLASSYYYVNQNENVDVFAKELDRNNEIFAVGVVDDQNKVQGIIIRRDLFDILGKPYGRDICKKKTVCELMKTTRSFYEELSIIAVSEELQETLRKLDNSYYLLVNSEGEFTGIFSTKSILIYLSDITQKDLDLARRLQTSIVKELEHVQGKTCEIAGVSKMAKGVGGDFYTVKTLNEEHLIVAICDVSGKGMAASLLTSILGGMFNAYDFNKGLKQFIKTLNSYIIETFSLEKFITGIIIDLNTRTGELVIGDMGHSYLFICSGEKLRRFKSETTSYPLGIMEEIEPVMFSYRLKRGDVLVLYTDGVTEQTNSRGREYGDQRLGELVMKNRGEALPHLRNRLLGDVQAFSQSEPQHDDITFLIIKFLGE